ncbi:MAG: MFS transporter [Thermoanaerobaculia bacterium]|nr:MFS transporter [Thermoanaerobaculia bacterium]
MTRTFRFTLLGLLYVSQAIPLGFFIVAVPSILRSEGLSLERVGLLSALAFPWLLKFLWAPLVDRFGSSRRGHYRSWILPLQLLCVFIVAWISRLDVSQDMGHLIVACGLFMFCSATQDVATDGLAVRLLHHDERGLGNGFQVGGYYLGQICGGGVVLLLYSAFGWTAALGVMALILALPIAWVVRLEEPRVPVEANEHVTWSALGRFFRRPGILVWVVVLLLWRAGETMVQWMVNPLLVDQGYSLHEIGLLVGIVGSLAALVGALLGGYWINRRGRRPTLLFFGTLQVIALTAFVLPALGVGGLPVFYCVVSASAAVGGMATAALYTIMMDRSEPATAATDFSLQQSLAAIGPVLTASGSGYSAMALGYSGHFLVAASVQVCAVAWVACFLYGDEATHRRPKEGDPTEGAMASQG